MLTQVRVDVGVGHRHCSQVRLIWCLLRPVNPPGICWSVLKQVTDVGVALLCWTSYHFTLVLGVGLEVVLVHGIFHTGLLKSLGSSQGPSSAPLAPPQLPRGGRVKGVSCRDWPGLEDPPIQATRLSPVHPHLLSKAFLEEKFLMLLGMFENHLTFHSIFDVNNPTGCCRSYCSATQKVCLVFTKSLPKIFNQMGLSPSPETSCKLIKVKGQVKY